MPDKTWKAVERRVAKEFSVLVGKPLAREGATGETGFDIVVPQEDGRWLGLEVKYRAALPALLRDALAQARKAQEDVYARDEDYLPLDHEIFPVVVLAEKRAHTCDYVVALRLWDFLALLLGR